jgi:hypothetical protein
VKDKSVLAVKGEPVGAARMELMRSHLVCYGLRSHLVIRVTQRVIPNISLFFTWGRIRQS